MITRTVEPRPRRHNGGDYIAIEEPSHPLRRANKCVRLHRVLLYEKIGPGEHPCHWCGKVVHWTNVKPTADPCALVVDHLDGDKFNNDPSNLAPACNDCNFHRAVRIADGEEYVIEGGDRLRAIRKNCEVCGKSFLVKLRRHKIGKGRFCSQRCSGIYSQRTNAVNTNRIQPGELCVYKADGKRERAVMRTCLTCGNEFAVSKVVVDRGDGRYCSKRCWYDSKKATV